MKSDLQLTSKFDAIESADRRRVLAQLSGLMGLGLVDTAARAQSPFPSKTVRVIIPTAAGAGSDVLSRAVCDELAKRWGQPIVCENRAGASGIIGVDAVVRSTADGYTLLMTSASPVTITPMVYRKLPYDPERSVIPVSRIGYSQSSLLVHTSLAVTTLDELITRARKNPRQLSYGSFGIGSGVHLGMEALCQAAGLEMIHVPYKGTSLALTDLLGGQISALLNEPLAARTHIAQGRLRALAVNGPGRHPILPTVPTFTELGYPSVEGTYPSFAAFAPFGTPKVIVDKISADIRAVLALPVLTGRFAPLGYTLEGSTPEELEAGMRLEKERWAKVIKAMGGLSIG